jgi:ATP-dependent RNA helicase SUPV3L1/SUV3
MGSADPPGHWAAGGFRRIGPRAVRLDIAERLEDELSAAAAQGLSADAILPKLVSLIGSDRPTLLQVLAALGWRQVKVAAPPTESGDEQATPPSVWRQTASNSRARRHKRPGQQRKNAGSPFSDLATLIAAD